MTFYLQPVIPRFWEKVEKTNTCWNWKANKVRGYGHFWLGKKTVKAHRFSYELVNGKIPDNLTIDHLCKNRSCVNPSHLEAVTIKENIYRGNGIWIQNKNATHCKHGHEYTPENTYRWKNSRYCRMCHKIRESSYRNQKS